MVDQRKVVRLELNDKRFRKFPQICFHKISNANYRRLIDLVLAGLAKVAVELVDGYENSETKQKSINSQPGAEKLDKKWTLLLVGGLLLDLVD